MNSNGFLNAAGARHFVDNNPAVVWIDLMLFDMNGIARGKRVRAADLEAIADKGLMLPVSVFSADNVGFCVDETGLIWETGDPDNVCNILADTLHVIPLDGGTRAQAVIVMTNVEDIDPHAILERQIAKLRARGLTPVTAVELEFYLSEPLSDANPAPRQPGIMRGDAGRPCLYEFADLEALRPVLDTIYRVAEGVGLPVDAILQEAGPGQLEINLKHKSDAASAACDGLLLRRAVCQAVQAHGLDATFMSKPHADWSGSGMHIHVSLIDDSGNNVLAGDPLSHLFLCALQGLAESMPDFTAIWAQTANAYRRFQPNSYVPMIPNWGFNNRTVSLRIPAGSASATRVEHRVAGADANPVLVMAAVLAGMEHGIAAGKPIGPASTGNGAGPESPGLPTDWAAALAAFERSPIAKAAFGARFQEIFAIIKKSERQRFERVVGAMDYLWYARI
jgi:glutamine synthetase